MKLKNIVGIILTTLALGRIASAETWTGTGDWVNTPGNWTLGVPTSTSAAVIQSGTVTVSTNGTQAIAADTDSFATVAVESGGVLTSTTFENETGATLEIEAGGTVAVSGQFTQGGGSTLLLGDGIDFSPGSFVLSGATTTAATVTVNGTDTATIGTVIADTNSEADALLKNGTGTLILNQVNTYSGGTEIAAGTIEAEKSTALGSGNVTVDSGASLQVSGASVLANNITITGTGAGGAGAIFSGDGLQNEVTGTVSLAGDASVHSALNNIYLNGTISLGAHELTLGSGAAGRVVIQGSLTGTGGMTVGANSRALITSPTADTYTGLTTVDAGATLQLGNYDGAVAVPGDLDSSGTVALLARGQQFAATTVVTLSGSGEVLFEEQGGSQTIAGLDGTSGTGVGHNQSGGSNTLTVSGTGTYLFAGLLDDTTSGMGPNPTLAVIQQGSGSQEFDGANTYSGGTTLTSGTLIAGNSAAFGTGLLKVSGGTLMTGNNNHLISVGSYAQTGGELELSVSGTGQAATADLLHVTNTLASQATLGGNLTINLANFTAPAQEAHATQTFSFNVVDTDAGFTGGFASFHIMDLASDLTASLNFGIAPNDVVLQLVEAAGPSASGLSVAGLSGNQGAILVPINAGLAAGNMSPGLAQLVGGLAPYSTNPAALGGALNALSPQAFSQFASDTAFNNASFETEAKDQYAAGRRGGPNGTFAGGNGGIDTSALVVNDPNVDPGLQVIHSRMLAWNAGPLNGTISDVANPLLGGTGMKDGKEMAGPAETDPWNFYVRGNVILAQGFSDADVSHFDDNTESVVAGADYRLNPNFLVGLSAGYGHTDVTLDDNGSTATVDSYSPGFYASYADKGWYANFSGDYIHNAYTQSREIGFLGETANSAPEGDEGVANLDGGYEFHLGALTCGPLAGLQYAHLTVGGYTESGSVADLSVNGQNADSLRSRLGGTVNYALKYAGVTFTPHLDATWQHEFMDQSRGITSQFSGAGLGSFSVRTDNPSRESALVDAGIDAEINQTVTLFADYTVQAGQANYFGQSVQAGVKIGF